jgi:F0F1-type ATP synthase gamma subunit
MTKTLKTIILCAIMILVALVANAQPISVSISADGDSTALAHITCVEGFCGVFTETSLQSAATQVVEKIPARKSSSLIIVDREVFIQYKDNNYTLRDTIRGDTTFTNVSQLRGYARGLVDERLKVSRR